MGASFFFANVSVNPYMASLLHAYHVKESISCDGL